MSAWKRLAQFAVVLGATAALSLGAARAEDDAKPLEPLPVPAPLPEAPHPVSDMLFDSQSLQARMAAGDKAAFPQQGARLRAIGAAILAAPPENWKNREEVEAAAAYLLGGGEPKVIQRLLESGAVAKDQDQILRGSLAYVIGRSLEAEALLNDIDPRSVSLRLGGQLAYAQSVLLTSRSPDRAIALLDLARILAPGSLVEEAALRREILMTGDRKQGDRVLFLTRQYVNRFSHSIYADNFIEGLASSSVRSGLMNDIPNLEKFEALLVLVTPAQRLEFLLTVSRIQTIAGQYPVAGAAADSALQMLATGSPDEIRARFYSAAAQFMGTDYDGGLANLKAIDRSKLPEGDQGLLAAVLHVASHLRDEPTESALLQADREDRIAAARSPDPVAMDAQDPVSATIRKADASLDIAEDLLSDRRAAP